jgi:hypothetical protein
MNIKRIYILLVVITIALAACSRNRDHRDLSSWVIYEPVETVLDFEISHWLDQMPEGDNSIGISYAAPPTGAVETEYGRDFAAIALSRNHSSYIVDKHSVMSLAAQTEENYRAANFNLVVSQDLDYLRGAAENLQLVSSYKSNGYVLSFYAFDQVPLDTLMLSRFENNGHITPNWALNSGVTLDNGRILSVASSRQATLMDAFNMAHEMALRYVGQHLVRNVVDIMRTENEVLERSSAFETVIQSPSLCFDKVYIRGYRIEGFNSYEVFIRIKERTIE